MMKKLEVEKFDGLKTHFKWNLNKIHYIMTSEYCNFDCCRTVSLPNTFFTATVLLIFVAKRICCLATVNLNYLVWFL